MLYVKKKLSRSKFFIGFILVLFFASCSNNQGSEKKQGTQIDKAEQIQVIPKTGLEVKGAFGTQQKIHFDSLLVTNFFTKYPLFIKYEKKIRNFYTKRNYSYAWYDENGLIEQTGLLFDKINNIESEGIKKSLLYKIEYADLMEAAIEQNTHDPMNEMMITAQYFMYADVVWKGLDQNEITSIGWDLPRKKISYTALLDSLLKAPSDQFLKDEPVYPQYAKLRTALKKYKDIQKNGGWETIELQKKSYKLGDTGTVIRQLRTRLFITGDLDSDNYANVFDAGLEKAIKNFQQRNGFTEDAVVGNQMISALNIPVEKRIEQIIVNMERCRWLPVQQNKDYLVVNIPGFTLHAYENDALIWNMKVVVGTSMNKTAIFSGMMNTVVFSPYWNVPTSIKNKEILPAIRRNKNYLNRNHMEWNGNAIRQKPGPWNALGKVKFLFPNSHSIYLHDTPSKSKFDVDKRSFSHGCIRLQDPKRLAQFVLRKQPEWTEAKIDEAMNASKEQYVPVLQPIPVYIAYLTCWVDKNGAINFRDDIYQRDDRLLKMITN